MSGSNGFHLPKPDELAAAAMRGGAVPQPAQKQVDPVEGVLQFLGLSVMAARALGVALAPCLCGRCQGFSIQFQGRAHYTRDGQIETFVPRAEKAPE